MNRSRKILALIISRLPHKALRAVAYRHLMGYHLAKGTSIGFGVMIAVDRFTSGADVTIRRGTSFIGPITVTLGEGTFIGRWNRFECGDAAADPRQAHMGYARRFETGRNCLINESHLFDILGSITIGDGSWVAGFASQFLTHGAGTMNRDIVIGEKCFLGTAVRFAPGSGVGDRVIVGMGAVVTKRLPESDVIVGGLPAKVLRARTEDDGYSFERTW